MKRIRDAQYSGDGPLKLIDGHTLSFADTLEKSPFIDIGIDEAKCVDPQWAAGLIEAELSPVYQDAHGVDRGRSYHARRNGMFLRFNTTPVTYRCVTSLHVSPEPEQRSSSEPTPPLAFKKSALTFEDLLLWPLEGKQSSTRLIEALERSYQMKALRESQFSGEGPLRLSDGRVLSFAYIRKLSGNIDIGVDEKPCVDPEQIAKLTRASLDPAYQDAHGVDQGRVYNAARNGMSVRFNTTPTTYRCVTAIHIRPTP